MFLSFSKEFNVKKIISIAIVFLLAACGGGGGGAAGGGGSVTDPVGVWTGTNQYGNIINLMVLPDYRFYSIYGNYSSGVLVLNGFDMGSGTLSGSSLSGSLMEYYYSSSPMSLGASTGTFTGTVGSNQITGSSLAQVTSNFTLTPLSSFSFSTAANLSNISGSWTGNLNDSSVTSAVITSTGQVTATVSSTTTFSAGCVFTGNIQPGATGKNYYDVTLSTNNSCGYGAQSLSGIGIQYVTGSGTSEFIFAVNNSAKNLGLLFAAQR
jgi:hypothetical protein